MKGICLHVKLQDFRTNMCLYSLYRNILTSVKETLDFEKGISILDVGCGAGSWIMVYFAINLVSSLWMADIDTPFRT